MKKYILKVQLPKTSQLWSWAYYQPSSILLNNWPGFVSVPDNAERFATEQEALAVVDDVVKLMKHMLATRDPMGALRGFPDEEDVIRKTAVVELAPGVTE
jgi:hypothetical protein